MPVSLVKWCRNALRPGRISIHWNVSFVCLPCCRSGSFLCRHCCVFCFFSSFWSLTLQEKERKTNQIKSFGSAGTNRFETETLWNISRAAIKFGLLFRFFWYRSLFHKPVLPFVSTNTAVWLSRPGSAPSSVLFQKKEILLYRIDSDLFWLFPFLTTMKLAINILSHWKHHLSCRICASVCLCVWKKTKNNMHRAAADDDAAVVDPVWLDDVNHRLEARAGLCSGFGAIIWWGERLRRRRWEKKWNCLCCLGVFFLWLVVLVVVCWCNYSVKTPASSLSLAS